MCAYHQMAWAALWHSEHCLIAVHVECIDDPNAQIDWIRSSSEQQAASSQQPTANRIRRQAAEEKGRNQVDDPKEDGLHCGLRLESNRLGRKNRKSRKDIRIWNILFQTIRLFHQRGQQALAAAVHIR